MEPEFLDPGPDQPVPARGWAAPPDAPPGVAPGAAGPGFAAPPGAAGPGFAPPQGPSRAHRSGPPARRESAGLMTMLLAAAVLPVVAARQTLYSVVEQNVVARESFTVSAWGDYGVNDGQPLAGHAPRFGIVLTLAGAGFGLLALLAVRLVRSVATEAGARTALGIAAAATGLVGVVVGVTAAMTLQIQSSFAGYQEAAGVLEVRLRVGGAAWLCLAAVLAGGLSVTAALRVRRAFREAASGY